MLISKTPEYYVMKYGREVKRITHLMRDTSIEANTQMLMVLDVTLDSHRSPLAELWHILTADQQDAIQKWDKKLLKLEQHFMMIAGVSVKKKLTTIHRRRNAQTAAQAA